MATGPVSGGYYGNDSAASLSLSLNQESWIQTTVQGAGTFSFWAKLSGNSGDIILFSGDPR